jgi:hypothetical protein
MPARDQGGFASSAGAEKADIPDLAARLITCGIHPSIQFSLSNPMRVLSSAAIVALLEALSAVMQEIFGVIPNI